MVGPLSEMAAAGPPARAPAQSFWNSGILAFSFVLPNWKPRMNADVTAMTVMSVLKKSFIEKTFHRYFTQTDEKVKRLRDRPMRV
jgi:hypothetical protein